jgi:pyruvate dehydrogenase E2 component (dihydrolipoyllysine-residue acetyltransferase)
MPQEVRMPALGQTSDELRIIAWLKREGEHVTMGEPLLEVETDKATLIVESAFTGALQKIERQARETVEAGTVIAYLLTAEEAGASNGAQTNAVGMGDEAHTEGTSVRRHNVSVLASPVARRLAREHVIEIASVRGSGPDGRIERRDVEALIGAATAVAEHAQVSPIMTPAKTAPAAEHAQPVQPPAEAQDRDVPRHRQVIAQRLTRSVQMIPQIALMATADMTRARAWLDTQRASGIGGLTYTHLILRAVARALRAHPNVNTLWRAEGPWLRTLPQAHVGLAIAGEDTLLVATIAEADQQELPHLIQSVTEATARGRAGALTQADLAPAAITVSNLGMHRINAFVAIVDPYQTAILAVGQVAEQAVARNGALYAIPQVTLTLTVDHRVADGVAAAKFLETICESLESAGS